MMANFINLVIESNMAGGLSAFSSKHTLREILVEEELDYQKKGNEYLPKTVAVFKKNQNEKIKSEWTKKTMRVPRKKMLRRSGNGDVACGKGRLEKVAISKVT